MGSSASTSDALEPTVWDHDRGDADKETDADKVAEPPTALKAEPQDGADEEDYWGDRPNMLVRIHKTLRRELFDPMMCSDPIPIPDEHIDVRRATVGNLETADEGRSTTSGTGQLA